MIPIQKNPISISESACIPKCWFQLSSDEMFKFMTINLSVPCVSQFFLLIHPRINRTTTTCSIEDTCVSASKEKDAEEKEIPEAVGC